MGKGYHSHQQRNGYGQRKRSGDGKEEDECSHPKSAFAPDTRVETDGRDARPELRQHESLSARTEPQADERYPARSPQSGRLNRGGSPIDPAFPHLLADTGQHGRAHR